MTAKKRTSAPKGNPEYIYTWLCFRDAPTMKRLGAKALRAGRARPSARNFRIIHKPPKGGTFLSPIPKRIIWFQVTATMTATSMIIPGSQRPSTAGAFDSWQMAAGTKEVEARDWLKSPGGAAWSKDGVCSLMRTELVVL